MATATTQSQLLTTEEAAEFLGLAVQTLRVWRVNQRVRIPFVKLGRAVKYRRSDLEKFLDANTVTGDDAEV